MTARPDASGVQHQRRLIAIAFAALIVCSGATLAIGNQLFGWFSSSGGWFSVESPKSKAPVTRGTLTYIAGRTLYRPDKRPQRLARPLFASPLRPDDTALAAASPDGRYVVYQTVRSESANPETSFMQVLYVHDTITRREKVLARGAHSVAWNEDGRIAYVKADHERYNEQKHGADNGQVVVQTLSGSPAVWTRRSNGYDVLAWAGDELIVEIRYCYLFLRHCREQPGPGVYALNRFGRLRPLNLAKWIALSPDGRYAFGVADRQMFNKKLTWRVRISRVDTGKAVTTLNLARPLESPGSEGSSFSSGSWHGNWIVLTHGTSLVFLTERSRQLAFESIIGVPRLMRMEYLWLLGPPSFTGPAGERVVVVAHGQGRYVRYVEAVLTCSRSKRSCVRVAYLPRDRSMGVFALVAAPSRP